MTARKALARGAAALVLGLSVSSSCVVPATAAGSGALRVVSGPSPVPDVPSTCSPATRPAGVRNAEMQPSIAVDPVNARHIATAWVQDFDDAVVVGVSSDGGSTWTSVVPSWDGLDPSLRSGFMACENGSAGRNSAHNPHVSIGKDGTVYAIADLSSASATGDISVAVTSSPDGGGSWTPIVDLASSTPSGTYAVGWTSVAADPRRAGVAYAMWDRVEGNDAGQLALDFTSGTEQLARTTDGGRSWHALPSIGTPDPGRMWSAGSLLVLPNGTGVDVFADCPVAPGGGCGSDTALRLVRSLDGGTHWSEPVDVAPRGPVSKIIDAAVSADGANVYVAWFDGWQSGSPHVAVSHDGGPFTTTSVPTPGVVTTLQVAVAADGTVGLLYDDERAGAGLTQAWLATSRDRGTTFSEALLRSPFPTHTGSLVDRGVGEYQGLRGTPGGFAAAITIVSSDAANPSDIWFADVRTTR